MGAIHWCPYTLISISIEKDTIERTRQPCYDLSRIATLEINHLTQPHVLQIFLGQKLS